MKEIIITSKNNLIRAAILEEGKLVEVLDDTERESRLTGSIYKGRVNNIVSGIQAAFVDIGLTKNAFLYAGDIIAPEYEEEEEGDPAVIPSIEYLLQEGQEVIVQIIREPVGSKGARVTTNLSLPGRFVVLLPNHEKTIAVSRKIKDEEERQRLTALAGKATHQGSGLIMRTLAEGVSDRDLAEDIEKLVNLHNELRGKIQDKKIKGLLYSSSDPFSRLLREIIDDDVDKIIVDDGELAETLREKLKEVNCLASSRVWTDFRGDLFERYFVNTEIMKALQPRVTLESGGYLLIEQTEALIIIDVNSGKFVGTKCLHDTMLKLNSEAACEVSRQIRLRNLSGIIIIDFIDMEKIEDWETLLKQLEVSLRNDKTKCQLVGMTRLGLVEVTRKKEGQSIAARYAVPCQKCGGKGWLHKGTPQCGK